MAAFWSIFLPEPVERANGSRLWTMGEGGVARAREGSGDREGLYPGQNLSRATRVGRSERIIRLQAGMGESMAIPMPRAVGGILTMVRVSKRLRASTRGGVWRHLGVR
jgi:hypothetical protein